MTVRDDSLWAKHVHDAAIRERIIALNAGDPIRLLIDGTAIVFRKMRDGVDGRRTPGLKADDDDRQGRTAWARLQERRGETVSISVDEAPDPYLAYLDELFWEWKTPGDAEAFDDL